MTNTLEITEQCREGLETTEYEYQIVLPNTRITVESVEVSEGALHAASDYVTEAGMTRIDISDDYRWRVEADDNAATVTVDEPE